MEQREERVLDGIAKARYKDRRVHDGREKGDIPREAQN
jgi:hypothetical protein